MRKNYLSLQNQAVNCAKKSAKFARKYGYQDHETVIRALERALSDEKLVIMTVGEARTGKSSLLGTYLRDDGLFPVDIDVTTCLITMVCYAEEEKITVLFRDRNGGESTQTISREQIPDYAKEQNNPDGNKNAEMILIETPNENLKDGVAFVDSPGIGSLNPLHAEITYHFLDRADIVLYVSDATSPINQSEIQFLKSVYEKCENIIFTLTKKELTLDYPALIEENRKEIARAVGIPAEEQTHVPVSSNLLRAYEQTGEREFLEDSNFAGLDNTIWQLIDTKRPKITLLPKLRRIRTEMEAIRAAIELEQLGTTANAGEIEEISRQLEETQARQAELLENSSEWKSSVKTQVDDLKDWITKSLDDFSVSSKEYINAQLMKNEYIRNPNRLKTEVIGKVDEEIKRIGDYTETTLNQIQEDFKSESGLGLDAACEKLELSSGNQNITFQKRSGFEQVRKTGEEVRRNSFDMTSVGKIVGTGIGAAAILFAPVSGGTSVLLGDVLAGAVIGNVIGEEVGGLIGAGAGIVTVAQRGTAYSPANIRKELNDYVSATVKHWNSKKETFAKETTAKMQRAMEGEIKKSRTKLKTAIHNLKAQLKKNKSEANQARNDAIRKRQEFDKLWNTLESVMGLCACAESASDDCD